MFDNQKLSLRPAVVSWLVLAGLRLLAIARFMT